MSYIIFSCKKGVSISNDLSWLTVEPLPSTAGSKTILKSTTEILLGSVYSSNISHASTKKDGRSSFSAYILLITYLFPWIQASSTNISPFTSLVSLMMLNAKFHLNIIHTPLEFEVPCEKYIWLPHSLIHCIWGIWSWVTFLHTKYLLLRIFKIIKTICLHFTLSDNPWTFNETDF